MGVAYSGGVPGGGDGAPQRVMFQGVIGGSGGPCLAGGSACGAAGGGDRSSCTKQDHLRYCCLPFISPPQKELLPVLRSLVCSVASWKRLVLPLRMQMLSPSSPVHMALHASTTSSYPSWPQKSIAYVWHCHSMSALENKNAAERGQMPQPVRCHRLQQSCPDSFHFP